MGLNWRYHEKDLSGMSLCWLKAMTTGTRNDELTLTLKRPSVTRRFRWRRKPIDATMRDGERPAALAHPDAELLVEDPYASQSGVMADF